MRALATDHQYKNKNIALIGYGVTGKACAKFLLDRGAKVSVFDQRTHNQDSDDLPGLRFYSLNENTRLHDFETVVVSPGVNLQQAFIQNYLLQNSESKRVPELIGDIELFARELAYMRAQNPKLSTKVVGVTGSNGKSTVVDMLSQCLSSLGLKVGLGGNFGTSALLMLAQNYDVIVLELSSFQLESTHNLDLDVASVLNVTPDHIDRHGSLMAYAEAKRRIYHHAKTCIFNRDDPQTFVANKLRNLAANVDTEINNQAPTLISFGQSAQPTKVGADASENTLHVHQDHKGIYLRKDGHDYLLLDFVKFIDKAERTPTQQNMRLSAHQKLNIQVVLAACFALLGDKVIGAANDTQASYDSVVDTILHYPGLAHRFSIVKNDENGMWVNDSKATNAGASIAAIESLVEQGKQIILIAGGDAKGADLSTWYDCVNQHVKHTLLIGKDADIIAAHLQTKQKLASLGDAVSRAHALLRDDADCAVLLSPACASLDMFDNYQHRGEVFIQLVIQQVAA